MPVSNAQYRPQGFIDIAECGRGSVARFGISGVANRGKDTARFGFARVWIVSGFETEEGVFERDVEIRRIDAHGFAEFIARAIGVACLQQCIGKVFPDVGTLRGDRRSFAERFDRGVVIMQAKSIKGFFKRFVSRVADLTISRCGQQKCKYNCVHLPRIKE